MKANEMLTSKIIEIGYNRTVFNIGHKGDAMRLLYIWKKKKNTSISFLPSHQWVSVGTHFEPFDT